MRFFWCPYDIKEDTRNVFSLSETSLGFLPVGHYSGVLQWGTTVGIYLESCIFRVNSLNKFLWQYYRRERGGTLRKILREGEKVKEGDGGWRRREEGQWEIKREGSREGWGRGEREGGIEQEKEDSDGGRYIRQGERGWGTRGETGERKSVGRGGRERRGSGERCCVLGYCVKFK